MTKEDATPLVQDANRYRHLRDFFALNKEDDRAEFAKLADLTGKEFDLAIDMSIVEQHK